MRVTGAWVGLTVACLAACGGGEGGRDAVVVTTELTARWDNVPHRLSVLELAFEPDRDGLGGAVIGENAGGSFGALDTAHAREAFAIHRGAALVSVPLSAEVVIGATGSTDPETFVGSGAARGDGAALAGAGAMVAWLRGYRISTDEYETPPPFTTDPVLPYDPADGFTTQGLGIQLGAPVLDGGEVVVPITVRNSLGPADRGDMNAAIPDASSWVRVDLLVVGAVGAPAAAARGEVSYTLSTATYGMNTEHPHADEALQETEIDGTAGLSSGLVGLSGFDLWLNVPGRIDPSCVVVQDPINTWDEMISGPGRYVTELGVRVWDAGYEPASGRATARVDLYLSNRSMLKEVGNICLGARAELSLLQVDAPVESAVVDPIELRMPGGRRTESAERFAVP